MYLRPITLTLALSLLMGCKGKPEAEQEPEPAPLAEASGPEYTAPGPFHAGLEKLFGKYLEIQTALAGDDFQKAKAAFSTVQATLDSVPTAGLDSAAAAYWATCDTNLAETLPIAAEAQDIVLLRNLFRDFSIIQQDLFEKFGPGPSQPVHVFHCPMARDNNGADWLQKDSTLANPYFGSSMLRCGNLVKTLKAEPGTI